MTHHVRSTGADGVDLIASGPLRGGGGASGKSDSTTRIHHRLPDDVRKAGRNARSIADALSREPGPTKPATGAVRPITVRLNWTERKA